ncbi:MAG: hypothetical protein NC091_00630 [Bacteroides sp.]|nr:hypothetical protein [Bacteroides sp.]
MDDREINEVGKMLDEICKQLWERATPITNINYAEMCADSIGLLSKARMLKMTVESQWGAIPDGEYMKHLKEEIQVLKNTVVEKERKVNDMAYRLQEKEQAFSLLQQENESLQEQLKVYTTPKTKQGNKNAYKRDIDSIQIYNDIKQGMSISEAARKYQVSRETVRKRYKEAEHKLNPEQ